MSSAAGAFFCCRPPIQNLAWPQQRMSGKIPTALGLTGGIASAWPRLTTLVFQGRGHFFMYIPYSRLAEASSKQAWQDHLRTLTYPNVLHCPAVDPQTCGGAFFVADPLFATWGGTW